MTTSLSKEILKMALKQTIEEPSIFLENTSPAFLELKPSAVLVLIIEGSTELELVLTRRAYHLKNHPGQISFAGGTKEQQDKNLYQTALREAHEEIGLPIDAVEILGSFRGNQTISGFFMTPIVGFSHFQGPWSTDPNEVHSMLTIPLDWAMKSNRWREETAIFRGQKRSYLAAWWQGQLIWGATAQLLENLRTLLYPSNIKTIK